MEQVHGHEVMQMMLQSGKIYTRATLLKDIHDNFGVETRFYTCSAQDMTAGDLISFLEAKGKFRIRDFGFQTSPDLMCSHDHDHHHQH